MASLGRKPEPNWNRGRPPPGASGSSPTGPPGPRPSTATGPRPRPVKPGGLHVIDPRHLEPAHVFRRDLLQRREAHATCIVTVRRPLLRRSNCDAAGRETRFLRSLRARDAKQSLQSAQRRPLFRRWLLRGVAGCAVTPVRRTSPGTAGSNSGRCSLPCAPRFTILEMVSAQPACPWRSEIA